MAKLMMYLACQVLLVSLLVEGSPMHSANGVRGKRGIAKPWSSLASCLGASSDKSSTANTMLQFIEDNTLIVPLISPHKTRSLTNAHKFTGNCVFGHEFNRNNTRIPQILAKAVCKRPSCDPASCHAVEYHVPVLTKQCSNANVWLQDFEKVTVAFR